jgi:hypothetical protein
LNVNDTTACKKLVKKSFWPLKAVKGAQAENFYLAFFTLITPILVPLGEWGTENCMFNHVPLILSFSSPILKIFFTFSAGS